MATPVTPNLSLALPKQGDEPWDQVINNNFSLIDSALTGVTYTNPAPTPISVGGIPAGTTFFQKTPTDIFNELLYPYIVPTFSSFSIQGQPTLLEVGQSTTANPTFIWTTTNPTNVQVNSISITSVAAGFANTGNYATTLAGQTRTTAGSQSYTISGISTNAAVFTRSFTITWEGRTYYGESASIPALDSDITTLRVSNLAAGASGTYHFNAAPSEYKIIAVPSYMSMSSFKDAATNLNVPFNPPVTITITNSFGATTDYSVYVSTNQIGGAISIMVS